MPLVLFAAALWAPAPARAHCDSLDGPVVADARRALESGKPDPVLRWVRREDEKEIRASFARAAAVRGLSPQARELADLHFFETLVRVHRAGEGYPYTGLKPAGTKPTEGVREAERAIERGSIGPLLRQLHGRIEPALQRRFSSVQDMKPRSEGDAAHGRRYVAAYVEFVHFVERLFEAAGSEAHHGAPGKGHDAH